MAALNQIEENTIESEVSGAGALVHSDVSESDGIFRKTGAGTYEAIKWNIAATTGPAVTDDSSSGYAVGSQWFDTTNDFGYICVDASVGAAVWKRFTAPPAGETNTMSNVGAGGTGFYKQKTGVDFELRNLIADSTKLSVTLDEDNNEIGIDAVEANFTLDNLGGTLALAKGGTGQTAQTAAFDTLAPTTTKGDIVGTDGSDNIRVAVGADGTNLKADSTETSGLIFSGGGGGTWEFISKTTWSLVTSVEVTTGFDSTYNNYALFFYGLTFSWGGGDSMAVQYSANGGSSWVSSGYSRTTQILRSDLTEVQTGHTGDSRWRPIGWGQHSGAGHSNNGVMYLIDINSTANYIATVSHAVNTDHTTGDLEVSTSGGFHGTAANVLNAVRFLSAANFSGTMILFGIREN